jgi:hypothetical protein
MARQHVGTFQGTLARAVWPHPQPYPVRTCHKLRYNMKLTQLPSSIVFLFPIAPASYSIS